MNIMRTNWAPTGNFTGTLNATPVEKTLASGLWWVWCDQAFKMSVLATTGGGIGATPTIWPANMAVPIYVGENSVYCTVVRVGTDGTYNFNRQFHQE